MSKRQADVIEVSPTNNADTVQTLPYGDILQKLSFNTDTKEVAILLSELEKHNDKLDANNTAMRDEVIKSLKQLFQVYQSDSYTKSLIVTDGIGKMIQSLEKSWKMDIGTPTQNLVLQLKKYQENSKNHAWNNNAEVGFGLQEVWNMNHMTENIHKKQIIIIGISDYAESKFSLKWTEKDMNNMDSFLSVLWVPPQNITKLTWITASKGNILRTIREKAINPEGILIYYAWHSGDWGEVKWAEKSDGFILPFDSKLDWDGWNKDTLISWKEIVDALGRQKTPPSLIFDSCLAGYIGKQISSSWAKVITSSNIEPAQDRFIDFAWTSKGWTRNVSFKLTEGIEEQLRTKDWGLFTTHLLRQWEKNWDLAEWFMSASVILQNRVLASGTVIDQTPTFFDGISDKWKYISKINEQMPAKVPN
jgi:Caspase domain